MPSVLFLGKADGARSDEALDFAKQRFPDLSAFTLKRGEPFPDAALGWRGDYIVSYLCPRVIPGALLGAASCAAINFHPGPPAYPGIGCTNFAIYNEETTFGVTCHHMDATVDSGAIIDVREFPLRDDDSVLDLTLRCYDHILEQFKDIMALIHKGGTLPCLDRKWERRPYRRAELEALCEVKSDMDAAEVRRRIRATTFPGAPGAYIDLHEFRFRYVADEPAAGQPVSETRR